MAKPIIGLDFGNFNSFACFISEFDPSTGDRMGGTVHSLLPPSYEHGIPSVYFRSKKVGVLCGEDAVRDRARPANYRLRYLKRHLQETVTLQPPAAMRTESPVTISYDEAITNLIQHIVRRANQQLKNGWQTTTNLISLSYPASYTFAQLQHLISLAEKATLEDGTKVKVQGTIAEPAAAALDYLAEHGGSSSATTVLTYDLGGGTFDLALVSVYPQGRRRPSGGTYYYDIIKTQGLPKVGGVEFDEIMYQLLLSKTQLPLSNPLKERLRSMAEKTKVELSQDTEASPSLYYNEDEGEIYLDVTRAEFEAASRTLLMQTVNATKEILRDHPNQQPSVILLTGGASQMPMVRRELEKALPAFRGKIVDFRPDRAIAYGAARFGTAEQDSDIHTGKGSSGPVQKRTAYDLGIRFYNSAQDRVGYISTYIPAGTPIPYTGPWWDSHTLAENQRYSLFRVCEARVAHPDEKKPDRDFTEIMSLQLDHGKPVPINTPSQTRLGVNKLGVLTVEARDPKKPGMPPIHNSVDLKNLR